MIKLYHMHNEIVNPLIADKHTEIAIRFRCLPFLLTRPRPLTFPDGEGRIHVGIRWELCREPP